MAADEDLRGLADENTDEDDASELASVLWFASARSDALNGSEISLCRTAALLLDRERN